MAITNYQVGTGTGSAAFTASEDTAVTVIYITNKTDGDGTVDVYVVPNGASVSDQHLVYSQLTIKARDTYIIDTEKMILETGARIFIAAPDSAAASSTSMVPRAELEELNEQISVLELRISELELSLQRERREKAEV